MSDEDVQLRLFKTPNPLKTRFDSEFFRSIPQTPGVYWMVDITDRVLYVGKAKDLRSRLRSYRSTSFERHSSKNRRLLLNVEKIFWDSLKSEEAALLQENELLRELRPPFNVVGTQTASYLYLAFRPTPHGLEVRLLFDLKNCPPDFKIYGAFKGITRVVKAHASLLRWLWATSRGRCDWPHTLAKKTAPVRFTIPWGAEATPEHLIFALGAVLQGLQALPEYVLPEEEPVPFLQSVWMRDQCLLRGFFEANTRRLRELQVDFGIEGQVILKHQIDDLIVMRRMRKSETPVDLDLFSAKSIDPETV